jgi:transaldolase
LNLEPLHLSQNHNKEEQMSKLNELAQLGQSVWYDFIRRNLLSSGGLKELVDQGVRGVTSNPAIFEKAIAGSTDYDDGMAQLAKTDKSTLEIYENLALEDIARAAEILNPVYERTNGRDGFVSLEVSPELANDTEKTVAEARRLFGTLCQPNVMIKVPATAAGIPAIEELIAAGINVNVTLIFGIENYKAVAQAYIAGAEKLACTGPIVKAGLPVERIASVASFFVSRVDSAVDKILEKKGHNELKGKAAIANAKVAYEAYLEIFRNPDWQKLSAKGAGVQRVLWASTSTKNPDLPDTLYVDELIGPDTVNTIPPATLAAFQDHGTVAETLTKGLDEAKFHLKTLASVGIDLDAVTLKLQLDGVEAFAIPFEKLLESIAGKRREWV